MDGSQSKPSAAPAPFLIKTYEMVDDPQTDFLVSWSESGCSFVVWNPPDFSKELLPKYFKHNNFSSFVRQLNTYGFRKIDPEQWEFANEEFIRGEKHLLNNIYRRKPIHSHSGQNIRLSDAEKQAYEEEIKRLQQDKSFLESELRRYQGQNHGVDFQIEVLRKQLQGMEQKQVRLMTCLAELMQKPGFTSLITQESDMHKKKRRLLEMDQLLVTSETSHLENLKLHDENCAAIPRSPLDLAAVEKLDNSLNLLENLLHEVDRTLVTQQPESGSLLWPLPATFAGRRESPEDSDRNFQTWSTASPASSKDVRSSPELPLCTDHVESPETSSVCLNMDISLKSSVIDMNLEPSSVPEVENLKEQILEKLPGAPTAVNDVFWEQFLTEAPCPSDSQEVQSERRDTNGTGSETNAATPGKFWWDSNYVNDLKKRMGNLAPAERV